jgi:hypothetical protein
MVLSSSGSTNTGTPNPLDDDGSMARAWQRHTGRRRQGRIGSRQASGAGSGVRCGFGSGHGREPPLADLVA